MISDHTFDLNRYLDAQSTMFDQALEELQAGKKRSHWMWFVFPQLRGLGKSEMAKRYGIESAAEARAYLAHPILNSRLLHCVTALIHQSERSLAVIFGSPDDRKFQSSMTLFACVANEPETAWAAALTQFCGGQYDQATLSLLGDEVPPRRYNQS